jgi:hydrogenase expression/formation protein HypC
MCVGIPGKVIEIDGRMATVEVGGATRAIALDLVDGVGLGDYIIAHAGFAIHKVDEEEALKTLEILREITEMLPGGEGLCEL